MIMLERLRATARRWADSDDPARVQAAEAFLAATGFSEEQVAYALNEEMTALASVEEWPAIGLAQDLTIHLSSEERQPLPGLAEAVAILVSGSRLSLPDDPAYGLVASFLDDAAPEDRMVPADGATLKIVRAEEDQEGALRLPWSYHAAVLDGKENEDARERLAEDVLLFDGGTARCVRVVWAPRGLSPDPYLEAFAAFRGRFPAPAAHTSQVRMMTAFAQKAGYPLAYLDDHSLLVTRGTPEMQAAGHLRWVEYEDLDEVQRWRETADAARGVLARNGFRSLENVVSLGDAHRPGSARFAVAAHEIEACLPGYPG